MKDKVYLNFAVNLIVVLTVCSCSTVNEWVGTKLGLDTDLHLNIKANADINPDDSNRPSPLFIRLYELKTEKMFKRADFIDLYERDKQVLGSDFVARQELKRIVPGVTRKEEFVLSKDTKYIALYAEFLNYKTSVFKVITPVTSNNVIATTVTVEINSNNLKLIQ